MRLLSKKIGVFFITISCIFLGYCQANSADSFKFKTGDIVFQTSNSGQSMAIQLATHSKYSHCGFVVIMDGKTMVFEAVQPVKLTPIANWISQGDSDKIAVKRLPNADSVFNSDVLIKIESEIKKHINKNYDLLFRWTETEMYCSELVWRMYKNCANIKLCDLHKFNEYDFSHPIVKKIVKERYGKKLPLDETVVSPGDIFNSNNTILIFKN